MPRRPRIHLDGMPLHIVQRGHNREACFFCEEDYQSYLRCLGEALNREDTLLHVYALVTNHVRLLVSHASGESVPQAYAQRVPQPALTLWLFAAMSIPYGLDR